MGERMARVGFLGQMEQFISSGKNWSKYADAVPFVKNDLVELGRLGRLAVFPYKW